MSEIPKKHEQEPQKETPKRFNLLSSLQKHIGWKSYVLITGLVIYGAHTGRNAIIEHNDAVAQVETDERLREHYAIAAVTRILIKEGILVDSLNGKVSPLDDKGLHWFDVAAPKEGGYRVTSTMEGSETHSFETEEEAADFLRTEYVEMKAFYEMIIEMQKEIDAESLVE